jgi:hypothetical protein
MNSESPDCRITEPSELKAEPEFALTAESKSARPRVACPGCGKLLSIRVLSEKHHCDRKPRIPWKMEPESLLERRKVAAIRRFEKRAALRRTSCVPGEAAG